MFWATEKYACGKNDLSYCEANCQVTCKIRPPADDNTAWFFVGPDNRENLVVRDQLPILQESDPDYFLLREPYSPKNNGANYSPEDVYQKPNLQAIEQLSLF